MKKIKANISSIKILVAALTAAITLALFSFRTVNEKDPVKPPLKGSIHISGTRFLFPLVEKWAAEFKKENPGVAFVIGQNVDNKDIDASAAPVKIMDSAKGKYTVVSRFALVPITNDKNPAIATLRQRGISKEDFLNIYFKSQNKTNNFNLTAKQVVPIHVYSRGACASATFTNHFDKEIKDLDNVGGKIEDDQVLLQRILADSFGIAYNNLGFVYNLKSRKQKDGISVIPIDINGNGQIDKDENFYTTVDAVLKYLEQTATSLPPTGDLTFIYKEDKPEVKAFVEWVLAKGQQYNHPLGFLTLKTTTNQ
jgi:phosphate transport system substrate-binding protein